MPKPTSAPTAEPTSDQAPPLPETQATYGLDIPHPERPVPRSASTTGTEPRLARPPRDKNYPKPVPAGADPGKFVHEPHSRAGATSAADDPQNVPAGEQSLKTNNN